MGRLLIVSNRLPLTVKLDRGHVVTSQSAGGLATGLLGPHQKSDSLWIGWPGDVSRFDSDQRHQIDQELSNHRAVPVHLAQMEISRFYEGFSNGVLWPLFHYQTDKVQRDAWQNWKTYVDVNERFARQVVSNYHIGDLIWVHDYQLLLVPGLLRRLLPEARIGFFLHIPFPSSEVFRILPWRTEVLEGMLGADLIGFHTYSYLIHFVRAVLQVLGNDSDGERLEYQGREVRLGVFPMGIDAGDFMHLAEQVEVLAEAETIRERSGSRKLLVGVDRLDYTKGLARRMLGVERLLEREPSLRRKVRLIQVVVPSRTKVESYEVLRRQLDEIVGRINGAYGTVNSVPIHYLYRSFPREQLAALYRAADVMLVTPLRDGMNLVAKEFIACRNDGDGILMLSEFAGAAAELAEALIVNPYDIDRVASTIKDALTMPEAERRARMKALRVRVQAYDCFRWVETFLEALRSERHLVAAQQAVSPPEEIAGLLSILRAQSNLILLLDYDGTLVSFTGTPGLAVPDEELRGLLRSLATRRGTTVEIVSGRTREILEQWLGDLPIGLHAEHGLWSKHYQNKQWVRGSDEPAEWKQRILPVLEQFTAATPGSLLEEKTAGIAWHYRMADPAFGLIHARELRVRLDKELSGLPVEILAGNKVLEVRLKGVNKALAVPRLVSGNHSPIILAMGDDQTDEDLFGALPPGGFAVHVGPGPSRAEYRVADVAAARSFLRGLLDME